MAIVILQNIVIIGMLAGISLCFHLISAGNFIPSSEMWMFGTMFSYVHSLFNLIARISLLCVALIAVLEHYKSGVISRITGISRNTFPKIIFKMMAAAFLASLVRMILPGPVTYYSFFYKLSVFLNMVASVGLAINDRSLLTFRGLTSFQSSPTSVHDTSVSSWEKNDDITTPDDESRSRSTSLDPGYLPSKRHRTAMELLQTETSYLRNLNTIVKVYKEPLEKAVAEGKPLLAIEDIKTIFGGIQEIANVHSDVHHDVSEIIDNWEEDCCVADVIKKYEKQLIEVYPHYVNYFDMGQSLLLKRQESNPDFYAFLVSCFNEPQSFKQTLEALLIRPVQRLPSLLLLISDLRKRTPQDLQDYKKLEEAKEVLRQVLLHINEDKRKTEAKTKIFDIVYEVTGCPPEIVSSNRSFVKKVDVTTLTDGFYRERERLALYLLNDALEIAKWRNRSHGTSLLKHIELLPLHNIISVMDLNSEDNIFAVRYRSGGSSSVGSGVANGYTEERVSILQLLDDKTFKQGWLQALAKQVAEVKNLPNKDAILKKVGPSDLLNFTRKNTKIYKRLKGKSKSD